MVATTVLVHKIAATAACTLILSSCSLVSDEYPEKEPQGLGQEVESLHVEVIEGLPERPSEPMQVFAYPCGEESQRAEATTTPESSLQEVDYEYYRLRTDTNISIRSGQDAPHIYSSLLRHLRGIGGWSVHEQRSENGFLGGIGGKKENVYIDAFHSPNKSGGIVVHIYLETNCYTNPWMR